MQCNRCKGLMVREWASDSEGTAVWIELWGCICCGNYIDEKVIYNRMDVKNFK